jgi:hypothetical protein
MIENLVHAMNDDGQFTLRSPDGAIIAKGPFSMLMERIPQSVPRMRADEAIAAAARAVQRERDDAIRSDALDQRERDLKSREDALLTEQARKLADGIRRIQERMDALEASRRQEDLASEIAAADAALKALGDDGDLQALKPSPSEAHAEEIEARGGASTAEEAIDDQDPAVSPSMPEPDPEPHLPPLSSPGGLPKSLAMSDDAAKYGRTFVRAADRKAWRKQMRSAHR